MIAVSLLVYICWLKNRTLTELDREQGSAWVEAAARPGPECEHGPMSSSTRDVDLDGYFRPVGYAGPREPSVALLGALVTAQLSAIPFENLDPVRGVPVADLGADALFAKLVHRRRGGFCFEQNGLLALVLRAAGFQVRALTGRVVWAHPAGLVGTSSTSGLAD